jgi:hypothetical protein
MRPHGTRPIAGPETVAEGAGSPTSVDRAAAAPSGNEARGTLTGMVHGINYR